MAADAATATEAEVDSLLARAEAHHVARRHRDALDALRSAARLAPHASVAPFEMGNLLLARLQANAEVRAKAGPAVEEADEGAEAEEAEAAFRAALATEPASAPSRPHRHLAPLGMVYNNLANLLSLRGRAAEAEALLRSGLRLAPVAYQYNGLASLLLRKATHAGDKPTPAPPPLAADDDDAWFEETSDSDEATVRVAAPVESNRTALLVEAASLLQMAISHERDAGRACGGGGGGGAPPMEHAYRENLAHVFSQLGRSEEAAEQSRLARSIAGAHVAEADAVETAAVPAAAPMVGSDVTSATRPPSSEPSARMAGWQSGRPLLVMLVHGGTDCEGEHGQGTAGARRSRGGAVAKGVKPMDVIASLSRMDAAEPSKDGWPESSTHSCGCPATFGTLQDVSASAAAMGALGYAVEVCACAPAVELGLDENGTYWQPEDGYAYDAPSRGAHTLVHVDHIPTSTSANGGTIVSRWVWERTSGAATAEPPPSPLRVDGVLSSPSIGSWLAAADSEEEPDPAAQTAWSISSAHAAHPSSLRVEGAAALLDPSFLRAPRVGGEKASSRFCYTQPPDVGLHELLTIWPKVRASKPRAILLIFSCALGRLSSACAAAHRAAASERTGVRVLSEELFGTELAAAFGGCAFDLIPVERPNGVQLGSLLRSQAAGVVPVSTRHLHSALPIGCGRWDLGPTPTNASFSTSKNVRKDWLAAVLAVGSKRLKEHREGIRAWAARQLQAQDAPARWHAAFEAAARGVSSEDRRMSERAEVPAPPPTPTLQREQWPAAPTSPPTPSAPLAALESELASLSEQLSNGENELGALRARMATLDAKLARCKAEKQPVAAAEEKGAEERAVTSMDEGSSDDIDESVGGAHSEARLCLLVLLDRPGGVETALHAARRQTSSAFRLVLIDRLHAARARSVSAALNEKSLRLISPRVSHLAAPLAGGRAWGLRATWKLARETCEEGGALETVAIARQHVWLPPSFVAATLHFHAGRVGAALLGYPIWQFKPPGAELAASAADDDAAISVFSPPLVTPFSRRGWRLTRRLLPAPEAALAGRDATSLGESVGALTGLSGVWSVPARTVASMADELIPASPGAHAERCFESGKPPKVVKPPKGVTLMLANLSVLCEALDTSALEPRARWTHDPAVDGGCVQ